MTATGTRSDRPLRILQILEPSGGGSGRHFLDVSQALKERGHHVEAVFSPVRAEERFVAELRWLGLDAVHSIAMKRAPGPSDMIAAMRLERLIRARGPFDIIHAHSSKAGALARLSPAARKAARIYTPHALRTMDPGLGRMGRLVFSSVERFLGRHMSDAVITVSEDEQAHALALGLPESVTRLVVNGVRPLREDRRAQIRKRLGVADEALVFGFIGRLSAQKAPERLIAAFDRAASRLGDAHLVMIGYGELEEAVSERIAASPHSDRIRLDGAIPGPDAMAAFDILVMPSRYEAMSYVMLEAEAAARPMILTDVGGASTVVRHGENGLIIPNGDDPDLLARAMIVMAMPDHLATFRDMAERRRRSHTIDAMIEGTLAAYRTALAARQR